MIKKDVKLDNIYFWSIILIILSLISNYFAKIFINNGTISFLFSLICTILGKCGMPLFIMIFGIYLVNKKFEIKDYLKGIIKIFLLYLIFTIICMFFYNVKLSNIYLYLINPINSYANIIFTILYLSILYPFIKKMVNNLDINEVKLFILLIIVYITFNLICPFMNINFNIPFINNLIYFIIVNLIYLNKNKLNTKRIKKYSIIINVMMFIYLTIITYLLSNNSLYFKTTLINNSNLLIVSYTVSVFYLLFNSKENFNYKNYSKYLFLSLLISMLIFEFIIDNYLVRNYYSFVMIPILLIIVFFSSFCISYLLINLYYFIRRIYGKKC